MRRTATVLATGATVLIALVTVGGTASAASEAQSPTGAGQQRPAQGNHPQQAGVLGPTGYKTLRMGMSDAQARRMGLLVDRQPGPCTMYYLRPSEGKPNPGGGVFIARDRGLVAITGTNKITTPRDVGMGATFAQVKDAYPKLHHAASQPDFVYTTPVPAHPKYNYGFAFGDGVVKDFTLEDPNQGSCG